MNKQELKVRTKKLGNFFKKHKKKFIIGTVLVGGTIVGIITKKKLDERKLSKTLESIGNPDIMYWSRHKNIENMDEVMAKLNIGIPVWISELDKDYARTVEREIAINNINIADIGKLGEELFKLDGVADDTKICAILYVAEPKNK